MVELKRVIRGVSPVHGCNISYIMYLYVCLFVCMLGFCSSFFLYVFFKRWIYVCSSGMSNVHTGIENTSQGGVSRGRWVGVAVGKIGWASEYSLVFVTIKGGRDPRYYIMYL